MNDIEERKRELKQKLENDLYVDRYSSFKESVYLINEALKAFDINYEYTYNQFCSDYTDNCMRYMDEHPQVDLNDPGQIMVHTLPILLVMIDDLKNKYGLKNDKLYSENTEQQVQEKTE